MVSAADESGKSVPPSLEFGSVVLDPPRNRHVCHIDAALAHHGHQMPIAQFAAQLPADAQQHNLLVELPAFEQLLYGSEWRHLPIIADAELRSHQNPIFRSPLRANIVMYAVDVGKSISRIMAQPA